MKKKQEYTSIFPICITKFRKGIQGRNATNYQKVEQVIHCAIYIFVIFTLNHVFQTGGAWPVLWVFCAQPGIRIMKVLSRCPTRDRERNGGEWWKDAPDVCQISVTKAPLLKECSYSIALNKKAWLLCAISYCYMFLFFPFLLAYVCDTKKWPHIHSEVLVIWITHLDLFNVPFPFHPPSSFHLLNFSHLHKVKSQSVSGETIRTGFCSILYPFEHICGCENQSGVSPVKRESQGETMKPYWGSSPTKKFPY